MWRKDLNIHDVKEIRVKTTAYLGVGAIQKIDPICKDLKSRGIDRVVVLTGKSSYKSSGAWEPIQEAMKKHEITYTLYDQVTPNPEVTHVNEATQMAKDFGAQGVIAIGGGSPIDAAKSVAILLEHTNETAESLYEFKFSPNKAVPIVAVNLTHGTGTEVDRFAVVSLPEKEYKPAIAYDCIYPLYAIDDPALMTSLNKDQSTYVSIDAINHITEACTTIVSNPLSILLAQETVRLVAEYLPKVREDANDLEARYYLAYASMIAGTSFDNGLLHFTHALEHPLSAVKTDLAHGLGLAILLPAVLKEIFESRKHTILSVFAPILGEFNEETITADDMQRRVREWLGTVGINATLADIGFGKHDVEKLTRLAYETPGLEGLLNCAPIKATPEVVSRIYNNSF